MSFQNPTSYEIIETPRPVLPANKPTESQMSSSRPVTIGSTTYRNKRLAGLPYSALLRSVEEGDRVPKEGARLLRDLLSALPDTQSIATRASGFRVITDNHGYRSFFAEMPGDHPVRLSYVTILDRIHNPNL